MRTAPPVPPGHRRIGHLPTVPEEPLRRAGLHGLAAAGIVDQQPCGRESVVPTAKTAYGCPLVGPPLGVAGTYLRGMVIEDRHGPDGNHSRCLSCHECHEPPGDRAAGAAPALHRSSPVTSGVPSRRSWTPARQP